MATLYIIDKTKFGIIWNHEELHFSAACLFNVKLVSLKLNTTLVYDSYDFVAREIASAFAARRRRWVKMLHSLTSPMLIHLPPFATTTRGR